MKFVPLTFAVLQFFSNYIYLVNWKKQQSLWEIYVYVTVNIYKIIKYIKYTKIFSKYAYLLI